MYDPNRVRQLRRLQGHPFRIGKLGHVVLNVRDVERSARFYIEVLGFEISDVYPEEMVPGGMVFLRCNPDHHGIALVGSLRSRRPMPTSTISPSRSQRSTRSYGRTTICAGKGSRSTLPADAAPVVRSPSNSAIPTITGSKFTGASIRSAATAMSALRASGRARAVWRMPSPTQCAVRTRRCMIHRCSSVITDARHLPRERPAPASAAG